MELPSSIKKLMNMHNRRMVLAKYSLRAYVRRYEKLLREFSFGV